MIAGLGFPVNPEAKVVEGLDVAQKIQQLPIQDPSTGMAGQRPTDAIYFDSVTVKKS